MRAPDFWSADGAAARLLAPLGMAFELAGRLRFALTRPVACGVPVVCVGNLVAGGAGKTPVAIALARQLSSRGVAAHFLTRGYGGRTTGPLRLDPARHEAAEVGDEALLLAAVAPTWVARDRVAGARRAAQAGAGVVVMDDGFQNPALRKDLSFVVVDGETGFGNGRVMPAGPLRETVVRGLSRADAVVVLGPDRQNVGRLVPDHLPVIRADLVAAGAARDLVGHRVLAFAGIGRPEKFFTTLRELGAELAETRAFADHHPYRPAELEALVARAAALDAIPVTTEKDRTRLPPVFLAPVAVLAVEVTWHDAATLDGLLAKLMAGG
jgi:tetraacyldisaccharide 4'-kinase